MLLYRRRWGLFYLPLIGLAALPIVLIATRWAPLPPRTLVLATGADAGEAAALAERYRTELARRGVQLLTVPGAGAAPAPLLRLANPADPTQLAFAHGLLADLGPEAPVQALAVVGLRPVWVFTRRHGPEGLRELRGQRLAAGPPGSPSRLLAQALLAQVELSPDDVDWVERPATDDAAARALLAAEIDALVLIAAADAPPVRQLARSSGIHLLGAQRASAIAAREPRLETLVLPQGAIELRGNVPPQDLTLLALRQHLLVRESLHPAAQRLLLDVAWTVHAQPGFLQRQADFPQTDGTDFDLSPVARRHALGERPWLERLLPYRWAQLAALLLYGVLPVVLGTLALLLWIPRFFSLRVNALLAHHYGELKFLEAEMAQAAADRPAALRQLLLRLDAIELQVVALDVPERFADRWYTLREHLAAVRERLLSVRGR